MSPGKRNAAGQAIVNSLFQTIDLSRVDVFHCFISIERFGEIDTGPIFERLWNEHPSVRTVVPRIDRATGELESVRYGPDVELRFDRWQIGEPTHDDTVAPEEVDIVIVPLLCFDVTGHRVGYGKGYYDRFLSRCRADCQKIGLSMFSPVESITDAHEGDVKLDLCITPDEIYRF